MKDIKGYEGKYAITKNGRVWSYRSKKYLVPHLAGWRNSYLRISLSVGGKCKSYHISRLVAETYIPNPKNYPIVDHINRNTIDNRLTNLRWVNYSLNSRNKTKAGNKSSEYIGVYWNKKDRKWRAVVVLNYKKIFLGGFFTEEEAHCVYKDYIKKHKLLIN